MIKPKPVVVNNWLNSRQILSMCFLHVILHLPGDRNEAGMKHVHLCGHI
jgi:hypothetical protein